ncbi:MAG: hypothetical protein ABSE73_00090 [Planctomycetota bacterium]
MTEPFEHPELGDRLGGAVPFEAFQVRSPVDVAGIKRRLPELDEEQKSLRAGLSGPTLKLRGWRDRVIALDVVREAYQKFDKLWAKPDLEERQYAICQLVLEVTLSFEEGDDAVGMRMRAWAVPLCQWK